MRSAIFSDDRRHRYRLSIDFGWVGFGRCVFVMLNPSTADEVQDDPTVRRCQGYARGFGCQGLDVLNIFAYRSTDPKALYTLSRDDAVGVDNDFHIRQVCNEARLIVCAWGNHGALHGRGDEVRDMLHRQEIRTSALKVSKMGQPGHPLYLRADQKLFDW